MRPIANAIQSMESDSSLLSEVPQWFSEIEKKTVDALEASTTGLGRFIPVVKELVLERKQFACTEVHFAANLVDPRYKGVNLKQSERLEGSEYISTLCDDLYMDEGRKQDVLSNLTEFRANAGIWSMESVRNSFHGVKPALWWKVHCEDQALMPIAVRLLTMPGTAAAVERDWSCYTRTHSKVRNRLKNCKTEMLVAIQMNQKYSLPSHLLKSKTSKKKSRGPETVDVAVAEPEQGSAESNGDEDEEDEDEVDLLDLLEDTDEDDDDDSDWQQNSDEAIDDFPDIEMDVAPVEVPRVTRNQVAGAGLRAQNWQKRPPNVVSEPRGIAKRALRSRR